MHADHVRVVHVGGDACLVEKALGHVLGRDQEMLVGALDGDEPLDPSGPDGAGEIHLPHAAAGELQQNLVRANPHRLR